MARKKKFSAAPNAKCPCGSGKKYKNCCGTPAQARARRNRGRWVTPVLIVAAVVVLLALSRPDGRMAAPERATNSGEPASAEPARAVEQPAQRSGPPPDWYYDPAKDQHWDPGHNHWHEGPPPTGASAERTGATPPAWSYDASANRHWHPEHNHWHEGPPPPEDERDGADGHEGHAH